MEAQIDKLLEDTKMTKAVLLQLAISLANTDDSQIEKINRLSQVSIKVLSKLVKVN